MDYFNLSEVADRWNHQSLLVIGIFSLILYHSTNGILVETAKTIMYNTSLVSAINCAASFIGPALVDHDEGTSKGEILIFLLLLNYFSLRRSVPPI